MKTMCPPGYHHNGFVAIHALDVFLFLIDPDLSFSLFLICSYFMAQSELQCSYKVCSYKKTECIYIYINSSVIHMSDSFICYSVSINGM